MEHDKENKVHSQKEPLKKRHKKLSKSFYRKVITLLSMALVIFALYNVFQISAFNNLFDERLEKAKELARPAEIQLYTITDPDCKDCLDISTLVEPIKKAGYTITKESNLKLDTKQAKELIDKYEIEKIPTIVILGEINKTRIKNVDSRKDALIYTQLSPPYVDTETNKVVGRVSATIIKDSSCDVCYDVESVLDQFKKADVKIVSEKSIESSSRNAKELIKRYEIDRVPTLILSKDLEAYGEEITNLWKQIGYVAPDGSYVTRISIPPYLNLSTNKIEGLVSLIVLEDRSCIGCYNASSFHTPILKRIGIVPEKEEVIDISSSKGKALIEKYSIEKVPTILLNGDLDIYPALTRVWETVGTVESDGTYVFREMDAIRKAYKDLTNDEVVEPPVQSR